MVLWATVEAVILGESSLTARHARGSVDPVSTAGPPFLHMVPVLKWGLPDAGDGSR
jgi:hypothetical protein